MEGAGWVSRLRPLLLVRLCIAPGPLYLLIQSTLLLWSRELYKPQLTFSKCREVTLYLLHRLPARRRAGERSSALLRRARPAQTQRFGPSPRPSSFPLWEQGQVVSARRVFWPATASRHLTRRRVTSALSREAALGRWQAPEGSRSSTTEDGDERRRRDGGSGASARGPGAGGGHDPGLGGGGAAPPVRVLFRLRDEGVAAAGGLSHREVPGGAPARRAQGGGGEVVPDRLDLLPGLPLPLGDPSPSRGFGPRGPWETRTGPGFLLQAEVNSLCLSFPPEENFWGPDPFGSDFEMLSALRRMSPGLPPTLRSKHWWVCISRPHSSS